jgi:hypothetical protein
MYFGSRGNLCDNSWGTIRGKVNLIATIDGVDVTNGALLPSAAHFVSGMTMWKQWCPTDGGFGGDCPGYTCAYLTYTIAGVTRTMAATGSITLDVAATAARSGIDFEFKFCNKEVSWGNSCGVVGSSSQRFMLYLPAVLEIESIASGDTPPRPIGASGVTVDFSNGPGGRVSAIRVPGNPPFPEPSGIVPLPGYWEVSTDMAQGTFLTDVTLSYDLSSGPAVDENDLYVFAYDPALTTWIMPSRQVDVAANRITALALNRVSLYVVAAVITSTQSATWGSVKALYHDVTSPATADP